MVQNTKKTKQASFYQYLIQNCNLNVVDSLLPFKWMGVIQMLNLMVTLTQTASVNIALSNNHLSTVYHM